MLDNRSKSIRIIISFFFLLGLLMSCKLWVPDRFFPHIPIPFISIKFNGLIGSLALLMLIVSLLGSIFYKSRVWSVLIIFSTIVLALLDQMRLQPWVYLYFTILTCLVLTGQQSGRENAFLNCVQTICVGIYFWSGLHKFNSAFLDYTFTSILETLFLIRDKELLLFLRNIGYVLPLVEIICGVLLFLPKTRLVGIYIVVALHMAILIFVSPLGINKNFIVIPWNLAMISIVFISFYKTKNQILKWEGIYKLRILKSVTMLLFWILPFLNFFSMWDSYLSFSLYSDKANKYFIAIEQSEVHKIDKRLIPFFVELPNVKGGNLIDVNKWSMTELNVPFYPEDRIFKKLSESFCKLGIENDKLIFLKISDYPKRNQYVPFKCK